MPGKFVRRAWQSVEGVGSGNSATCLPEILRPPAFSRIIGKELIGRQVLRSDGGAVETASGWSVAMSSSIGSRSARARYAPSWGRRGPLPIGLLAWR